MDYQRELDVALAAATLAGKAILELYATFERIADAPANIQTEADRQAQETILQHVHRAYPDDALCAEERTPTLETAAPTGPRLWIVDPIDGTRGFARKNNEFSVMVGFVHDGRIAVGVVCEPAKQRLTYASRAGGCWRRDGDRPEAVRCRVSSRDSLTSCTLVQSRSRDPGVPTDQVQALRPAQVVETYSAGIKPALVARGEADVYVNRYQAFHDWDICAGQILVEEAGGKVTGLAGQQIVYGTEGAWQRHGLLATNGTLHEFALARLRA